MTTSAQGILPKGFTVKGLYTVVLFIKKSATAETYRVRGPDGKLYFLKLFNISMADPTAFDGAQNLLEIEVLKKADHPNIVPFKDCGELIVGNSSYSFLVLHFIVGETLAGRVARESILSLYDIRQYGSGILQGLGFLHSLPAPVIHNDITLENVMIDLSGDIPQVKLIDFSSARLFRRISKSFNRSRLNPYFVASECFHNQYSPQSDLFSVGVVLYYLVFGTLPWYKDLSRYDGDRPKMEELLLAERAKPLALTLIGNRVMDMDPSILAVIEKALHANTEMRFKTAAEFQRALLGETKAEVPAETEKKAVPIHGKKRGFSAIAGMIELKKQLQLDVIDALRNPTEYEKYGITMPNGLLLYGPPGCGKTFFSKHFAEEVGFSFIDVKPSTLQSKFINETQEKIAKMFQDAEKTAPTVIFIDELDALVPNRGSDLHEMQSNAVNEFLAQMSNCSEKGIFIVGATNRPDKIDVAILRAGRLDKKVYLPPPDLEARKAMFEMYLKSRQKALDFGIDYDRLAMLTENYVSADIELLVNEASRNALQKKAKISMTILEKTIQAIKPSVSLSELKKYEALKLKMDLE